MIIDFKYTTKNNKMGLFLQDSTNIEGFKEAVLAFPKGKSDNFGDKGCLLGLVVGYSNDGQVVKN